MPGRRITFGWHLDGQRPTSPRAALGESLLGPAGLLSLLETQLGLLANRPAPSERIMQYRDCLKQCDGPKRFYHRSFHTDDLGTAATLLAWRDHWHVHGWDGTAPLDAPARVRDLADVEKRAAGAVAPNVGQRLQAVHDALAVVTPDIAHIALLEPPDTLPLRWQHVLAALPTSDPAPLMGQGTGFLGQLQQALEAASQGQAPPRLPWHDDGTVVVVRAETPTLAQHWLATQLTQPGATLLLCEAEGTRLDLQLGASGAARHGLSEASAYRPALQLLPLALELLWEPLRLSALIEFLTHPLCPIPAEAARPLAEKVADAPGIGGSRWQNELDDIDARVGEEQAVAIRDAVALWLENPRFPVAPGAPLAVVSERVARLSEWLAGALTPTDTPRAHAASLAHAQCKACLVSLQALQRQGESRIRPQQLQKLVAQATAPGAHSPLVYPEVGAEQLVQHPGAIIEPAACVVWAPLARPGMPAPCAWSEREIAALACAGVQLPSVSDQLEWAAAAWLRPVMAAQQQLVLVLPPAGEEVHPVWHMLEAMVEQPRIVELEHRLTSPGEAMEPLERVPLPPPKRWWQLPAGVPLPPRAEESFSSLEKLLFNPYHYLLQYPAKLKASQVIRLGGDYRLYGNLAHGLIEEFFKQPAALTLSHAEFETWFKEAFARRVEHEGAHMLAPGRGMELENFRKRALAAMEHLREQLRQANVVHVEPEKKVAGPFPGGKLSGSIDLMLKTESGKHIVVDMKWSGEKKYTDKFQENRHLQLALYAELVRQKHSNWPALAYFILDQALFLAPATDPFAGAKAVAAKTGESTPQVWQRFVETWHWRHAQLQAGQVEVVHGAAPPDEASTPPPGALILEMLDEQYNDYRTLAGWSRP